MFYHLTEAFENHANEVTPSLCFLCVSIYIKIRTAIGTLFLKNQHG